MQGLIWITCIIVHFNLNQNMVAEFSIDPKCETAQECVQ
jgi:hypothetical protein